MTVLSGVILGKIIFYYIIDLVEKGINYFNGNKETKKVIIQILGSLESNKRFIDEVVKLMDNKKDIDDSIASKMVKLPYVQTLITKGSDSTNGQVTELDIENGLKAIFLKTWSQHGEKAIEKVKKDLK
jgi:hypothetical protein